MTTGSSTPSPLSGGSEILLKAIRKVLSPLVRLMLAHGVGYRQAAGLLKQVYVDVANRELLRSGDAPSTSRLSLFTGIHRKDIKRLLGNEPDRLEVPPSVALGAPRSIAGASAAGAATDGASARGAVSGRP